MLPFFWTPLQICCAASLAPGEDPAFLANQAQPAQQLTPEVAAQLIELLRAGLDDECPVCELSWMAEVGGRVAVRGRAGHGRHRM